MRTTQCGAAGEEEPSCLLMLTSPLIFCCAGVQDLELRWQEYYELVTLLLQWIRHHVVIFEERKFPTSYEEIEVRSYVNSMSFRLRHV